MVEQDAMRSIRNKNMTDILDTLREKGSCSLSTLTEHTDGGLTTVKKCVQQAMDCGMIREGEIADSTGGRKAKQYEIENDYQYFLLLILDNNDLFCRMYDFGLTCVKSESIHIDLREYYGIVRRLIGQAVQAYPIGTVCLSLPCVVKDGVIVDWFYNREMQGVDLKSELEQAYGVQVIVQNDMKLSVLGVSGIHGEKTKNIVTMQFGHNGIGVGEMVNGHVLEGFAGFAGEVSYLRDFRKNIMSIGYPAKIVRSVIVCLNPEQIVFFRSDRQNQFDRIFETAVRELPEYAVPAFRVEDDYIGSIIKGLFILIHQYGYFRKPEEKS